MSDVVDLSSRHGALHVGVAAPPAGDVADVGEDPAIDRLRMECDHYRLLCQQLERAVVGRTVLEQAKGILAERHQISFEQAFELLRKQSRNTNVKIHLVARAVVEGRGSQPRPEHP